MLRFNLKYFFVAVILFLIEVAIALFLHDRFVRPYVGDFLAVILLYALVRAFINGPVILIAMAVLFFAYVIEYMQYVHVIQRLGWQDSRLANIVLGYSFAWIDMMAYTLGIIVVVVIETFWISKKGLPR